MARANQETLVPTAKARQAMVLQAGPALEKNKAHQADLSYQRKKTSSKVPSAKMVYPT